MTFPSNIPLVQVPVDNKEVSKVQFFRNFPVHFLEICNMSKRQLLLLSSSNYHGHEYLQFAKEFVVDFLKK